MAAIGKDIAKAKMLLESGELVGIPTETVYGLAGNAFDPDAVAKIFAVKDRPSFDPLIIHTASLHQVSDFTTHIPDSLFLLAKKYWPGPLTLLLERKPNISDLVTSGLDTVAVRVPQHPLTLSLLASLDFPLAAPSANPFGYISPTKAEHVNAQLGDKIPYILDGGDCEVGLESTIVGMENGQVTVYRLGGLDLDAIESVVGRVVVKTHSSSNPKSPGMLKSHYAPKKPFVLGNLKELVNLCISEKKTFAVLSFKKHFADIPETQQLDLSLKGDLDEAAKNLFAAMRALDSMDVSVILAELLPEEGLGRAINDRLRRAAADNKQGFHHFD